VPAVTAGTLRDGILINVPQRMLFQLRGGAAVTGYPIAAGRPTWRTPIGEFEIDTRATDKPWIVPVSIQEEMRREGKPVKTIVPPGPDNPLGRHWLGLSESSCGIHGTIAPSSIYSLRTHGCIRLHPDDVAKLYGSTALGEPVHVVYEPLLLARLPDGRICLEAHPDAYARGMPTEAALAQFVVANALVERVDWTRVREVLALREGIALDVTQGGAGEICT
jgi:L,D-transpeptidase ErfK/SrfK